MSPTFPSRAVRLALLLALAVPASPPACAGEASAAEAKAAQEEEALLERLAARAEQYSDYALGFTCEELIIRSYYDAEKGTFRRRDREVYDYLFERSEKSGRLGELRELIEENGRPVRRSLRHLGLDIPPSYAWSQIFARENRGRFHFKLAGRVLKGYRLLILIDFMGWAAEPGKGDITGWSGRASVDSGTLNLYSIEAEPSGQAVRIAAERLKFQRAFAIMGVPLAAKPRSRALKVSFGFDNEGLTYPTETTLVKSVYVSTAEQAVEEKVVLRYRSYRFFKVGTQIEEARDKPADPNAFFDPNVLIDPNAGAEPDSSPPEGAPPSDPPVPAADPNQSGPNRSDLS